MDSQRPGAGHRVWRHALAPTLALLVVFGAACGVAASDPSGLDRAPVPSPAPTLPPQRTTLAAITGVVEVRTDGSVRRATGSCGVLDQGALADVVELVVDTAWLFDPEAVPPPEGRTIELLAWVDGEVRHIHRDPDDPTARDLSSVGRFREDLVDIVTVGVGSWHDC